MPGARISAVHGTARPTDPETGAGRATTYALYHPAAALRQQSLKETMLTDMCGLPDVLIQSRTARTALTPTTDASATDASGTEATPVTVAAVEPATTQPAQLDDVGNVDDAVAVSVAPTSGPREPQLELFG
jgi:hypothetical protein